MTRKRIQLIASLLITACCLYLAFRSVPLRQLWLELRRIQYLWVIPFAAVTLLSMYFRTVRWKYLLEPVLRAPSHQLFPPLIICFALNAILPGRAGEFARAYLVARDHRMKFSSAFATVVVERLADGLGLLALFAVILAFVPLTGEVSIPWGKKTWVLSGEMLRTLSHRSLILCVLLLVGTVLMLWGPFRRFAQAIISRIPLVPHRLKDGLNRFIETFVQGFHSLQSPRLIFWVVIHTGTVWLTVGWSLVIMSYGFPEMHMTMTQGMATAIIICIAILVPAAPGYWGLYEVGCILALQMLGVVPSGPTGRAAALSYSLVAHSLQMLCTMVPGFWFLWRRQMRLADLTRAQPSDPAQ